MGPTFTVDWSWVQNVVHPDIVRKYGWSESCDTCAADCSVHFWRHESGRILCPTCFEVHGPN